MINHGRPLSRSAFLRGGSAAVLGLTAGVAVPYPLLAGAATDPLQVDLAEPAGTPGYPASGFLHGLSEDGSRPPDDLLLPLKPRLFRGGGSTLPGGGWSRGGAAGFDVRWRNVVDRFGRASAPEVSAEYCIVFSDLWGANGVDITPEDPYPGDDGDWTSYEQFVERLMASVRAAEMRPEQIQLEIWNEPDYGAVYWPRPKAQYEEMWRRGVRQLRSIDPRFRIEGPTFTWITDDPADAAWRMDEWLDMVVASDTAPDILAWHALLPDHEPVTDAALARRLLADRGLTGIALEINEYLPHSGQDVGYNAWYVARLERAEIDYTALAIYGACCLYPELDGLLARRGEELLRTARWWVYERYASITGELVAVRPTAQLDAVAGLDRAAGRARILIGNTLGDGTELGGRDVMITGLSQLVDVLAPDGRLTVRTERIDDAPLLEAPEVLSEREYPLDGDKLSVKIDWTDSDDAYVITLGRQDDQLPQLAVIGVEPDPVIMIGDHPTEITFRLRNFSDRPLSVEPSFDVSAGYRLSRTRRVVVPANGDATVTVTVTRPGTVDDPGRLTMAASDQSRTVELVPSDNWVRIARLTASSTHSPSRVENLNDGRSDSADWGDGGAGGWNDDTAGVFPDTVTATWPAPVPVSRIRLFTLDSAAYPAAAWGVRDLDLHGRVNGSWRSLAEIRGNVAGLIETAFDLIMIDALRVTVQTGNDGTYSRLLEIEAY